MGIVFDQKPVRLITSLIYKDPMLLHQAEEKLKEIFGPVEEPVETFQFDKTDYYYPEMGSPLERKLLCFKVLVTKDNIYKTKLQTNKIEDKLSSGGKRTVNIDPGYVTEAKLVLLTTKDYTHRVYIGNKIFAESTLYFKDGTFNAWPWTYPDYASSELIDYFNRVREKYVQVRR